MVYGKLTEVKAVAYPREEWGVPTPNYSNYDSRDLPKNAIKFVRSGVSSHLQEFEGRGPRLFRRCAPTRVLDTALSKSYKVLDPEDDDFQA